MNQYFLKRLNNFFDENFQERFRYILVADAIEQDVIENKLSSGIYFKIYIFKHYNDLVIGVRMIAWSNELKKHTSLKHSYWNESDFLKYNAIEKLSSHYQPIVHNFLKTFDEVNRVWQIKSFIYNLQNPIIQYNYKLHNLFTLEELKTLSSKFDLYPNINVYFFKNHSDDRYFSNTFIPDVFDTVYLDYFEISVDLDDEDMPIIFDLFNPNRSDRVSKHYFFKELEKRENE